MSSNLHLEGGFEKLSYVDRGIAQYKKKHTLFDFTDMILEFIKMDNAPTLDVVIVDEAQVTEKDTVNHYLDSDDIKTTVSTGNTPVSNIEHERNLNEDKFSIKYIQPEYRDKVVSEFRSLMRG